MQIDPSDLPPDQRFGRVFAVLFLGLAGYWAFIGWIAGAALFGAASVALALTSQWRPALLNRPNRAWALLGLILGKVVGTFVLGLIFLTIMTPIALLFRLIGRDELGLQRSAEPSYWSKRNDSENSSTFSDQF